MPDANDLPEIYLSGTLALILERSQLMNFLDSEHSVSLMKARTWGAKTPVSITIGTRGGFQICCSRSALMRNICIMLQSDFSHAAHSEFTANQKAQKGCPNLQGVGFCAALTDCFVVTCIRQYLVQRKLLGYAPMVNENYTYYVRSSESTPSPDHVHSCRSTLSFQSST